MTKKREDKVQIGLVYRKEANVMTIDERISFIVTMFAPTYGHNLTYYMRRRQMLYFRTEKGETVSMLLPKKQIADMQLKYGDCLKIKPVVSADFSGKIPANKENLMY